MRIAVGIEESLNTHYSIPTTIYYYLTAGASDGRAILNTRAFGKTVKEKFIDML